MDEDDDREALEAVYGTGGSGSGPVQTAEAEAKVRSVSGSVSPFRERVSWLALIIGVASGPGQSIKCSECGKVFRNAALANFHAEKSGHDQFEESTEEVRVRAPFLLCHHP